MAKIPDPTNIAPQRFSGVTKVVSPTTKYAGSQYRAAAETVGTIHERAKQGLGKLREMGEQVSSHQTGLAKVNTDAALTALEKEFKDRKDYQNFDKDFDEKANSIIEAFGGGIMDGAARDQFQAAANARKEQVRATVDQHADNLWKSEKRVTLQESLDRAAAAIGQSDLSDIDTRFIHIAQTVTEAYEAGYIDSPEDVKNIIDEYREKGFVAAFNGLGHEKQGQFINNEDESNPLKKLDPEIQAKLRDKWRTNDINWTAQNMSENALSNGLTEEEALEEAYRLDDVDKQDAAVRRIQNDYAAARRLTSQRATELYSSWDLELDKGVSLYQLQEDRWDEWQEMTPAQRNNLEAEQSAKLRQPDIKTDANFVVEMMQAENAGDWNELARLYNEESAGRLSSGDRVKWADTIINGPKAKDNGLTDQQIAAGRLMMMDLDKKYKDEIVGLVGDYRLKYQENNNGKNPDSKQVTDYIDSLLIEYSQKQSLFGFDNLWPDTEVRGFELTEDDKMLFNDVIDQMIQNKIPVTPDNVSKYYNAVKGSQQP